MASAITQPNLISILIYNPNSIFVIQDAENIVIDSEKDGNSPVSAFLNISVELLADCLCKRTYFSVTLKLEFSKFIICLFNTDISKIDSALMRKERLIAKYEFKELETAKEQQLLEGLVSKHK